MTAAIYARVSTKDKGQTNENQLRELRAFAERLGFTLYKECSTPQKLDRLSGLA